MKKFKWWMIPLVPLILLFFPLIILFLPFCLLTRAFCSTFNIQEPRFVISNLDEFDYGG